MRLDGGSVIDVASGSTAKIVRRLTSSCVGIGLDAVPQGAFRGPSGGAGRSAMPVGLRA